MQLPSSHGLVGQNDAVLRISQADRHDACRPLYSRSRSYRASVVANPSGHRSHMVLEARGGRLVAPDG
jgi:hypothetical protein